MDDNDQWERTIFLVLGNLFFFYSGIFKVFLIPGATHLTRMCEWIWNVPFSHEFLLCMLKGWKIKPFSSQRKFSSLISFITFPPSPPWTPLEWYCFSGSTLDLHCPTLNRTLNLSLSLFKRFSLMWTIFKVFIKLVTTLLLFFIFWFFRHQACENLAPWSGIKPAPSALEGEVLTTGPPGKAP